MKPFIDILSYEEENEVPYITSIERTGLERGREEGRWETLQRTYERLIANETPLAEIQDILGVTDDEMERLKATRGQ